MAYTNRPALSGAVLVQVDQADFELRLPDVPALRLDLGAANLLRALVERANNESYRKSTTWTDRHALSRAHQKIANAPITLAEADAILASIADELIARGLEINRLIERNKRSGDVRLRRDARIEIRLQEAQA